MARAIRNSAIPVISAVGHETDFTIADFAADLRAPTPSAAAELVAAHEEQLCSQLDSLTRNLARSIRFRLSAERSRVQQLAYSRGFDEVRGRLRTAMTVADDAEHRLQTSIAARVQSALRRLDAAAHALTPSHLRERVATGRARFDALCHARDAALTARMERAGQQFRSGRGRAGCHVTFESSGARLRDCARRKRRHRARSENGFRRRRFASASVEGHARLSRRRNSPPVCGIRHVMYLLMDP